MTRTFYVEITCQTRVKVNGQERAASPEQFEAHLDEVMEALLDEPGATDADLGARLDEGIVDFCLHLDAEDAEHALSQAKVIVRSALHKVGTHTPGWESMAEDIKSDQAASKVRPAELVDC